MELTLRIPNFCLPLSICVWITTLTSPVFAEDWERIARETDEPGFAMQIGRVSSGSQADRLGLRAGDYVYQIGEGAMRGFLFTFREVEKIAFLCRKDGKKETVKLAPGKLGVWYVESFRPQIDYLRGEIGSRDARWDTAVTAALAQLEREPEIAAIRWDDVRTLGYPGDDLNAFVHTYCAWKGKREIPLREAYAKINEEFKSMPRLYASLLEDMAFASGATDILQRLHDQDPASSLITTELVEGWKMYDSSPLAPGNPLDEAIARRDRDLREEIIAPVDENRDKLERALENLLRLPRYQIPPGRFIKVRFCLPEGVQDFHYSITLETFVREHHEQFTSEVRLGAAINREDGKRLGSRTLAELAVISSPDSGTTIGFKGGYSGNRRLIRRYDVSIPVLDEAPPVPAEFRIDLIRIGREIAAYCDGFLYCRLPIDPEIPTEELDLFVCGMDVKVSRFELWSLKAGAGQNRGAP